MIKEFREFAMRGNVIDLAIGIIIGSAFQKIVTSLVNDIIMPLISLLTGKVDLTNLSFKIGEISVNYGNFMTAIIDFLLIAFVIFIIVRYLNKLHKKLDEIPSFEIDKKSKKLIKKKKTTTKSAPTTKSCPFCYTEVNIKATKCPNCTSNLKELDNI